MKATIITVPIKTVTLNLNYQSRHQKIKSQSRQIKANHHVRNSILVRNKNNETLQKKQQDKRYKQHKKRLSFNASPQNKNNKSRKSCYTPDIFNPQKQKPQQSIKQQMNNVSKHLYKSEILKRNKNNFPEKKISHNLFPTRKLYHNKYYYNPTKQINHPKKMNYSCTYHNHISPINPHFLQEILQLQLPNPQVYYRTPSSPTKERAVAYRIGGQQISPWKIAKDDIYDLQ